MADDFEWRGGNPGSPREPALLIQRDDERLDNQLIRLFFSLDG
jgi:hypothetical protein